MKVYISAPFELQASGRIIREILEHAGVEVTSTWLDERENPNETKAEMAERDYRDIFRSDAVLLINPSDWSYKGTGGRHAEIGIAITLHRSSRPTPVFIYGVRSNVFHHDPCVRFVSDSFPKVLEAVVKLSIKA